MPSLAQFRGLPLNIDLLRNRNYPYRDPLGLQIPEESQQ